VKNPYPKETKDHKIWEEGFNVGFNAAIVAILAFAAELGKESFRKCLYEEERIYHIARRLRNARLLGRAISSACTVRERGSKPVRRSQIGNWLFHASSRLLAAGHRQA